MNQTEQNTTQSQKLVSILTHSAAIRRRLIVTGALLLLVRFGCFMPLPGLNAEVWNGLFEQHALFKLFNLMMGGGLRAFSPFALGVLPATTSLLLVSLLAPFFPVLRKFHSHSGTSKMGLEGLRLPLALPLDAVLTVLLSWPLLSNAQASGIFPNGQSMFLIVLGGLISGSLIVEIIFTLSGKYGIGLDGPLLMAMGILGEAARTVRLWLMSADGAPLYNWRQIAGFLVLLLVYITIAFMFQNGKRNIPVQYAMRVVGRRTYGGQTSHLSFPVLAECVSPLNEALCFLVFVTYLLGLNQAGGICDPHGSASALLNRPSLISPLLAVLVTGISFLNRVLRFNPKAMAEDMITYGGYIPGIRAGERTANYLDAVITRLALMEFLILWMLLTFPGVVMGLTGIRVGLAGLAIFHVYSVTFLVQEYIIHLEEIHRYENFDPSFAG